MDANAHLPKALQMPRRGKVPTFKPNDAVYFRKDGRIGNARAGHKHIVVQVLQFGIVTLKRADGRGNQIGSHVRALIHAK